MININWWQMYEKSKTYSKLNANIGVTSEMIWGCQWDAMLRFILTTEDSSHVTASTNVGHTGSEFKSKPYQTGGVYYEEVYTGSVAYNDISANIYDLEGNCIGWTQLATDTSRRVGLGGNCNSVGNISPTHRGGHKTTDIGSGLYISSRLSIY